MGEELSRLKHIDNAQNSPLAKDEEQVFIQEISPEVESENSVDLLTAIRHNVDRAKSFCEQEGLIFKRPLLILGTFERVGSNWLLDTLGQHVHTHNEPFKQQLGESSPYSTMSPQLSNIETGDAVKSDPFATYWLETFVSTKYGTVDHAVKETNLFFAVKNFLKLFPDAPILVLKREAQGILSSFIDQNLAARWNYDERYNNLKTVAESGDWEAYRFIFNEEAAAQISQVALLARLLFLNSLLLADSLNGREFKELAYESSVKDRVEVLNFLSTQVFPDKHFSDKPVSDNQTSNLGRGTFSPLRKKSVLESYLNADDVAEIAQEMRRLFSTAQEQFAPEIITQTRNLIGVDQDHYHLAGRREHEATSPVIELEGVATPAPEEFINGPEGHLSWRNKLVTNQEFCHFLNELHDNGVMNVQHGGQVFFNENMINGRGGRIHFNQTSQQYEVSSEYDNHPVYWLTWIGAAAFALRHGSRLPSREELDSLVRTSGLSLDNINAGHKFDDVSPINSANYKPGEIIDLVGNLAVWCADGADQSSADPQSSNRYIYGTAWNRPATMDEVVKDHSRPIIGNSRAVGIRLVRDKTTTQLPLTDLVDRLKAIPQILQQQESISLRHCDAAIIKLLSS